MKTTIKPGASSQTGNFGFNDIENDELKTLVVELEAALRPCDKCGRSVAKVCYWFSLDDPAPHHFYIACLGEGACSMRTPADSALDNEKSVKDALNCVYNFWTRDKNNPLPNPFFVDDQSRQILDADVLLVGRRGIAVGLKMALNLRDRMLSGEEFDDSAWPRVSAKGDGEQGRCLRRTAIERDIPLAKTELPVLLDLFENYEIGEEISTDHLIPVVLAVDSRDWDGFMGGRRRFRSKKALEMNKPRIARKGHMYKLFVENHSHLAGYDIFKLYSCPNDAKAIELAHSFARFFGGCYNSDRPKYTFPFRLFCVNPDGEDRLVVQYKPTGPAPPWKVYVLIGNRKNYNGVKCFYSQNDEAAIREAHEHVRHSLVKSEHSDSVPEDYVPCPYWIFHKGILVYEYTPPTDTVFDPELFHENVYRS